MKKPVVLLVLDGWGIAPPGPGNAISLANLQHIPSYEKKYAYTQLAASGNAVGLPPGEDGNTETGHLNIGAGRIVYQDLPRINMSVADGSFVKNDAFVGAFVYAKEHNSNVHIMGLLGDGMVHSNRDHLYELLHLASTLSCKDVYLHLFTDGRDSAPNASSAFVKEVEDICAKEGVGTIATIMGRYYAMDRDRRWERTQKAYNALTQEHGGAFAQSAKEAIEKAYGKNITDEFIEPTIITGPNAIAYPRVKEYDSIIFFNFRIDRPRQLTRAFVLHDFEQHQEQSFDPYTVKYYHKHIVSDDARTKPFTRAVVLKNLWFVTMTEYERNLPVTVAFPPLVYKTPLGRVITDAGLRQLRASETEKERFVTYYFNGMREEPFPGEDRLIVPSPSVATYDLKPDMSSYELTERVLDRLATGVYSFAVVNYAAPDMVGHTGNIAQAIKACQAVDECVSKIVDFVLSQDGAVIITGDHGNVEEMLGSHGEIDTEHSTYPVPCIIISKEYEEKNMRLPGGKLGDIGPTILYLMGLPVPQVMTGDNLLREYDKK